MELGRGDVERERDVSADREAGLLDALDDEVERVAKYNQLLRIEELLGDAARYAGDLAFPRFSPESK